MDTIAIVLKTRSVQWLKITLVITVLLSFVIYGLLFFPIRLFASFPITAVGGIVINAPEIDGTNFLLTESSSLTEQQANYPTAKLTSDMIQFPYGFTISKTLDFSATPLADYGISKVLMKFTITTTQSASNASLQLSGIQSDQATFTTGYDSNGNPVMVASDGTQQPLNDVSNLSFTKLTNASLNVHSMNLNDFNWNQVTVQIIPLDTNGNPISGSNGSFNYDSVYEYKQIVP